MAKPAQRRIRTLEEAFGHVLTTLRKKKNLTQVDLSVASGYSQRSIGILERGEKSPTLRTMEDFATLLDVPLEKLIGQAKTLLKRSKSGSRPPRNARSSA